MYAVGNYTYEEVEVNFCEDLGIKSRKITDKKFIEILNVCWGYKVNMNFMGSAYGDGEDIEYATKQEFKKFVLFNLYDWYFWHIDGLRYSIKELFKRRQNEKHRKD